LALLFTVLGVLLVVEGIPYFAFPAKVREWALALQEIPDRSLRLMGLICMAVGLLVLFLVRGYLM